MDERGELILDAKLRKQQRELSRKRSLKASTKELQDLTNLIRKTKNSPNLVIKTRNGKMSSVA